jgi:hypothetical protein
MCFSEMSSLIGIFLCKRPSLVRPGSSNKASGFYRHSDEGRPRSDAFQRYPIFQMIELRSLPK